MPQSRGIYPEVFFYLEGNNMIEIKCSRILSYIINAILLLYQLPQLLIGLIGLAIFRNYTWYTNEQTKVHVLAVDKGFLFGTACFSAGPIIFITPGCSDITKRHETGHSKQSLYFGPLFLLAVAVPSVCIFWYRRLFKKSHYWYHSKWPENHADKLANIPNDYYSKN